MGNVHYCSQLSGEIQLPTAQSIPDIHFSIQHTGLLVLGYVFPADEASTILKKSVEIIDWITGWVILPLESTCGLTLSGGYLKFVYSNETMPNPRAQVKALQIFTPNPHEKLHILCMNSHWFLLDQGKAMLKMLWNSRDQGRPETSCNYLWALLLPNSWCQNSSCVWDSFLADFVRIV